ncbi:MAG: hypothetical protein M2R45_05281 [Verrucomicrobia subdivision 3 bacterium]|nr:hypothetical protein [Limisphaerales bacterium]MCS1417479.1 hypothetical protein [Limisphaerales bacterium]
MPPAIGASLPLAVTHPLKTLATGFLPAIADTVKTVANSALFVGKVASLGVITAGMLLFGAPVGIQNAEAQDCVYPRCLTLNSPYVSAIYAHAYN